MNSILLEWKRTGGTVSQKATGIGLHFTRIGTTG